MSPLIQERCKTLEMHRQLVLVVASILSVEHMILMQVQCRNLMQGQCRNLM